MQVLIVHDTCAAPAQLSYTVAFAFLIGFPHSLDSWCHSSRVGDGPDTVTAYWLAAWHLVARMFSRGLSPLFSRLPCLSLDCQR